jgi:hypothetical protein
MKRKMWMVLGLLLVLSLGLTTVAQAAEVEGSGRLWAKGVGYAHVHGRGVVDISGHGAVTVWVKGADELRAQGRGRRWDLPNGTTVFAGWRGHIHAEGEELDVKMLGGILEFNAQGSGWVFLKGRGYYRIGGESGRWTPDGVRLELSPAEDTQ